MRTTNKRLTTTYETYDLKTFEDYITIVAANIEDGWMGAGAVPGDDYCLKDILRLATEYAWQKFNTTNEITICEGWPK